MKRLLVYAAFVFAVFSCNDGGNADNQGTDTTSPASGATGEGLDGTGTEVMGTGADTTGINVDAAFPVDSSTNTRPINDEPGSNKSGVSDNRTTPGGTRGGNQ